jgi:YidC/Oxa1 family membrane protein insertase
MDRKQLTGLIIISAILIGYNYFFAPKLPPPVALSTTVHAKSNATEKPSEDTEQEKECSTEDSYIPNKDFIIENDNMRVILSSHGGHIKQVILKKYNDSKGNPLVILDAGRGSIAYTITLKNGETIETKNLIFNDDATIPKIESNDEKTQLIILTAQAANNRTVVHQFRIDKGLYTLNHIWDVKENDKSIICSKAVLIWKDDIKPTEEDIVASRNKTTINYLSTKNKFDYLKENSSKREEHAFDEPMKWIAIKQRFFTSAIIAQDSFTGGEVSIAPADDLNETIKKAYASLNLSVKPDSNVLTFYFGPNDYKVLKSVNHSFAKNIPLGWPIVRWINSLIIIPIFGILIDYISNYGIIIILLVLLIKAILLPISYRAYISTAKMKLLKPALDDIKSKFGTDTHKIQVEYMKLYREVGVNPLGGLGLILLQMPILLAMFNFIPNEIAFRGKAFLWAHDLSTYDSILTLPFTIPAYGNHISLFTMLMTLSTILHTMANSEIKSQQGPIKVLAYVMPITFMFILNSLPAALSFYYFISNLATLGIQFIIKKFVDEEKIKKQLEDNKTRIKSKPTSSFKSRLEAMIEKNNTNV